MRAFTRYVTFLGRFDDGNYKLIRTAYILGACRFFKSDDVRTIRRCYSIGLVLLFDSVGSLRIIT